MNWILTPSRHVLDGVLLACLSLGALYATARVGLAPRDTQNGVAVIFAPWTSPASALTRAVEAGGRFVRFGGLGFIAVVMPEDSNYSARALDAGAWLVADPRAIAGCFSTLGRPAAAP